MTSENQEKLKVTPGLVKAGYEKPKTYIINPTLQIVVEELPVAEKAVTFREGYANSLMFDPLMAFENVLEIKPAVNIMISEKHEDVNKFEKVKEAEKPRKEEKVVVPEVKVQKTPSDIEVILSQAAQFAEPEIKSVFAMPDINMEIPNMVKENVSQTNVFETINSIQIETDNQLLENNKSDKDKLLNARPFMKVDKIEVRSLENGSGELVYVIDKKICSSSSYKQFIQEVSGKILALDCKTLMLHDIVYTKQQNGTYMSSDGTSMSVDDLLAKLHN